MLDSLRVGTTSCQVEAAYVPQTPAGAGEPLLDPVPVWLAAWEVV